MALDPINTGGLNEVTRSGQNKTNRAGEAASGADFKKFLTENLDRVNQMQVDADQAVEGLLTGEETDITKVMSAVQKADLAFKTVQAVRNKLVESYQEVLRMRI